MLHPDSMRIEYRMRRDQFLAEANLDRLADLAAQARRKPQPTTDTAPSRGRRWLLGSLATVSLAWLPLFKRSVRAIRD